MRPILQITSLTDSSSWLLLFKGELFKAPVKNPQKILDLGTGTGVWAIDYAESVCFLKLVFLGATTNRYLRKEIPRGTCHRKRY